MLKLVPTFGGPPPSPFLVIAAHHGWAGKKMFKNNDVLI